MAEIAYPATDARILQSIITPVKRGQIVHQAAFSDELQILNRAYGHFEGNVTFQPIGGDSALAMEAFFNSLDGRENFTHLPLNRGTIPASLTALTGPSATTGLYTVADATGLKVGQYFRSGNRTYQIISVSGLNVGIWPSAPLATSGVVAATTYIRAASRRDTPQLPKTADWSGPWSWAWEERL